MSAAHPDAAVRIDGFDAFRRIGNGGFSSVYSARQISMARDVAVKVLNADFGSDGDRRTFERECQALGLLSRHPNIVTVYSEAFTVEGRPCIVMELYHGNYRERLDSTGPIPLAELLALGVKVAGALQAAHDRGILHRDLKPHNIFQSDYGEPALGDFGISTIDDERSISGATGLSVAYAAPEVLEDARATPASDIYSLAATLFHLAEGSAPFASAQLRSTVKRILTEPVAPLSRADAPVALSRVLMRGMAKEDSDRFASAEHFAEALRDVQASIGFDRTEIPLRRSGGFAEQPAAPPASPSSSASPTGPPMAGSPESTVARRSGVPRVEQARSLPPTTTPTAAAERADAASSSLDQRRAAGGQRVGGSGVDQSESTIVRQRDGPAVVEAPDTDERGPSRTRRTVAMGLGTLAIGAVVIGLLIDAGGGDGEADSTTTAVTISDDGPVVVVDIATPAGLTVDGDESGEAVLSFDPVPGADQYLARSVFPSERPDIQASSETTTVETGTPIGDAECWVVLARAVGGQLSSPSEPVCID